MKNNKNWIILMYALILSIMISVFALIIINKQWLFISNLEYNYYDSKMGKNIYNKSDVTLKNYINNSTWAYSSVNWYIKTDADYNNIFWANKKNNDFIKNSSYDWLGKIWDIWTWVIYIDIDNTSKLKYVEFDNDLYNNSEQLKYLTWFDLSFTTWNVWYLSETWIVSSISSAKQINFSQKNIALFLSYNSSWSTHSELEYLTYSLKVYGLTWSLVYANPIKNISWIIKYFWQDIIHEPGVYYSKNMVLTR